MTTAAIRRWRRPAPEALASAALLLLAVCVRLVYIAESRASPFFDAPVVDAQAFFEQAGEIAAGDLRGSPAPFWQPPLYPYLLGLQRWLLPADAFFVGARALQALFAGLSCVLLFRLARTVMPLWAAAAAAAAFALYGPAIYFDGELLAVSVEVLLYLGILTGARRALDSDTRSAWLVTGICAGLAAITRPTILPFVFVLPLLGWSRRSHRQKARAALPLALGALLTIAPVTLRNVLVGGEAVLISANGGINFHIGNNAHYDSTVAIHPGHRWEALVLEPVEAGHESFAARSRYFYGKALAWAGNHPFDYAGLLLKKTWLLFGGPEIKRNESIDYAREHSHLLAALLWQRGLAFPFGVVGPLALLGLALTWRRDDLTLHLLRAYVFAYGGVVVLFFVVARYRVPLVPALLVFALLAVQELWRRIAARRTSEVIVASAVLAGLGILAHLAPAGLPPEADAQLHHDLGEVHLRRGRYELAAHHSRLATRLEPGYPNAHHNLAVAELHRGRDAVAKEHAEATLGQLPYRADTRVVLARAYMGMGDWETAGDHLRRALDEAPELASGHYYYGRALARRGNFAAAITHLRRAAEGNPDDFWVHFELAKTWQRMGSTRAAIKAYQLALAIEPKVVGLTALGSAYLQEGNTAAAVPLLEDALARDPGNADVQINLGYAALLEGRPADAVGHYRRALQLRPGSEPARRGLERALRGTGGEE